MNEKMIQVRVKYSNNNKIRLNASGAFLNEIKIQ